MPKYKFEIQNCIEVTAEGEDREEARNNIIDDIEDYAKEMVNNCYVSEGEKIDHEK